jgi:hypothetical protein
MTVSQRPQYGVDGAGGSRRRDGLRPDRHPVAAQDGSRWRPRGRYGSPALGVPTTLFLEGRVWATGS